MPKYEISVESMPENSQLNVQFYPTVKPSAVYLCPRVQSVLAM